MESLLESANSYLYFLWISLPVGIAFGLLFFSVGYIFTNPRVRRFRLQADHYKEECARMSRSLASINSQHQELLENLQGKDRENLVLQSSLETKDEELVGLLQRLNNVALEANHLPEESGKKERSEIARLKRHIAELTGRLKTSESALRDQNSALAIARQQLADVSSAPEGPPFPETDQRWNTAPSSDINAPASETAAVTGSGISKSAETIEPMRDDREGEMRRETWPPAREAQPETPVVSAPDAAAESTAAAKQEKPVENGIAEEPVTEVRAETEQKSIESARSAHSTVTAKDPLFPPIEKSAGSASTPFESGFDALTDSLDKDAAELASQFAEFEDRLRQKEAEFFAFQDQFTQGDEAPSDSSTRLASIHPPQPGAPGLGIFGIAEEAGAEAATESDIAPKTRETGGYTVEPPPPYAPSHSADAGASTPSPPSVTAFPPLDVEDWPPAPKTEGESLRSKSTPLSSDPEQIIFRGNDPALWGKSGGAGTVPFAGIESNIRYLRIRRADTGQSVVISMRKEDLSTLAPGDATIGWNGKGESFESAHHLGIFDHSLPQEVETRFGAGGWGFGHFYGKRGGQAYCWAGIAIAKTNFEISVLNCLPDPETLRATDSVFLDSPTVGPAQEGELVFFHSAFPEIWNKNVVDGRGGFALNVCRLPRKTRFIKVRRADNGSAVVIPVALGELLGKTEDKSTLGWNGSNEFFFGGFHLGICDPKSSNDVEIKYGCGGFGFGHIVDVNDRQAFAWAGRNISRTPFEFTAIARDLTPAEQNVLLNP